MIALQGDSFNQVYYQLLHLFTHPENVRRVSPRGMATLELNQPIGWTIKQPWRCWLTVEGRKLNPFFASSEIFWIISGRDDVEWIAYFNSNMRRFADPGRTRFNAGYGYRIFKYPIGFGQYVDPESKFPSVKGKELNLNQLEVVVKKLREDPNTRRAVALIWHPLLDNQSSLDLACNLLIHFTLRDGALHTMVTQRSCDLVWGAPYNSVQFQHIAAVAAAELNVPRGTHTHVVNSLHVYEDLYKETWEALQNNRHSDPKQDFCNAGLPRAQVIALANWVDRLCFGTAHYTLNNVTAMLHEEQKHSAYWAQLFTLPLLYYLYKEKRLQRQALLEWAEEHLWEGFVWMMRDFWRDRL